MRAFIKIPLYLIALVLLGLVSGHFTFKLLSFSKTIDVPELRGKSTIEANDIVRPKGMYLRLDGEDFDPSIPQGRILRQDIPSGSKAKEGREIRVIVSKGPRFQYTPEVVGQPLSIAESMASEKGIRISKVIHVHSDKAAKDVVIAQRPETNEKGSDTFSVVVSLGEYEGEGRGKTQNPE